MTIRKEPKGTALVKKRDRFLKLIEIFPEREEFYRSEITAVNEKIKVLGACRRCGRPLRSKEAKERGYGDECAKKAHGGDEE